MNKRTSVRFKKELFPGDMSKADILLEGDVQIESSVVNYCAHGIQVNIPIFSLSTDIPKKNENIKVQLRIDKKWFTGICIYSIEQPNSSISLGIYFSDPDEQDYLYNLLVKSINNLPESYSFISHEWEELVGRMCHSDDPCLRDVGFRELEILKLKNPDFKKISAGYHKI